jgi:hypothetical protein
MRLPTQAEALGISGASSAACAFPLPWSTWTSTADPTDATRAAFVSFTGQSTFQVATNYPGGVVCTSGSAGSTGGTLLSQGKPVTASSVETVFVAASAVDGDPGTRWGSAFSNSEWIYVDLGATATISRVVLNWEAAFATGYQIQTAASASGPWTTIFSTTTGDGGIDDLSVSGTGRFVRMNGTQRALTNFGYSLWELQVYGR